MPVDIERHDRIMVIRLNRPEAMNSIDPEMFLQLDAAWSEFEGDDGLAVAVVTGAGERAFCAGRDLVKSAADAKNDWSQPPGTEERRNFSPERVSKPVLAAINGHCLAAGLALALACDIRIASPNATFGTMAARRGIVAGGGQTQRLARYIPFGKAMELILTGDRIDAAEAHRSGLVNSVVELADLMPAAMAVAERIAANGPLAVRAMKKAAYEGGLELPLKEGLRMEGRLYAEIMKTTDAAEGQRAFAEKREPRFQGR